MENIILPSEIKIKEEGPNKSLITIEPCYYGYGITLGNALRRVLLSSLPGAAVTAVKIKGAQHEFSTLPYVKEDVLEIILNLKLLRLKVFSEEPIKLNLKVIGEKKVKAADIEKNAMVEIVNPDLLLATLTNANAELDMEILVSQGRGYVTTEERSKEQLEIGTIAIDSIFTPIKNVGYQVENVRVGEITNYDKLIFNIETDGTITPQKALEEASQILINHFSLIIGKKEIEEERKETEEAKTFEAREADKEIFEETEELPKRKRGRPAKKEEETEELPKRKRGRPKK